MHQAGDVLTGQTNQMLLATQIKESVKTAHYHPYHSPPDLAMAKIHGKAKRVYVSRLEDIAHENNQQTCPCCGLYVEGELIPISADLSKIYHLGSGYPLYFQFIKCSIALLIIIFLLNGCYSLLSNSAGGACFLRNPNVDAAPYCVQDYISAYSIANKSASPSDLEAQLILNFITVIVIIVFFHYIRYELRKITLEADDNTITPSDYTIKLVGVPHHVKTKQIKQWIESFGTDHVSLQIRKITRSYDLVDYVQLIKERDTLAYQKETETVPEAKEMLKSQVKAIKQKIDALRAKGLRYAGICFVTFNTAKEANFVIKKVQRSLFRRGFNHIANIFQKHEEELSVKRIKIKRAPEPSDVLWENLGISRKDKKRRKHLTTLLTALFVLVSFGLVFLFSWAQDYIAQKGGHSSFLRVLSMGASVFIVLVNYVLGQLIRKLAEYEKHGTYTGYFTGIANKLSIAQFINTAFTILIAKLIVRTDVLIGDEVTEETFNFYGPAGLTEAVFFIFISNAFLTPLMAYFDVFYYLKLFQRWALLRNPEDKSVNQKDAHGIFENLPIDMSYKYALLVKTMLLTFFYAPGLPIAYVLSIAGLILVYWADKFVLLRRTALPFALGDELTNQMVESMEWIALMFSLGNVVFAFTLVNPETNELAFSATSQWLIWLPIALSLIHIFLPMDQVNRKLFPIIDEVTENDPYEKARPQFSTDYDIENPITRDQGIIKLEKATKEGAGDLERADLYTSDFEDEYVDLLCDSDHEEEEEEEGEHEKNEKNKQKSAEALYSFLETYITEAVHQNPCQAAHHNHIPGKAAHEGEPRNRAPGKSGSKKGSRNALDE